MSQPCHFGSQAAARRPSYLLTMSSKTVEDLTDEELLIIFRGPDSPLDGFDLVNLELVCKRW